METVVYILLGLTSVVGLAFIIERAFALRWRKVVPPEIEAAVQSCQAPEDVPMLRRVCQQHDSPMSRLLVLAADHLDWSKADTTDALQTRARRCLPSGGVLQGLKLPSVFGLGERAAEVVSLPLERNALGL